jgi:preprotein translocase subunit SecY
VHTTKITAGSAGPVLFASATIPSLSLFTNILPQNWVITGAIQSATRGQSNLALLVFAVVTIIFARTYASISNDPVEIANSTTKSGSFILGVSPGISTARYFYGLNSAMGWGYSIVIIPIMFFPIILQSVTGISSFALLGGTLFIPVLVISEIVDGILVQRKNSLKSTKII